MSLSPSPAFWPCGIPVELDPALELELDDDAAGGDDALEVLDEDEPPPHPATARAATTSDKPNHRLTVMELMFIGIPLLPIRTAPRFSSFPDAMPGRARQVRSVVRRECQPGAPRVRRARCADRTLRDLD